MSASILKAIAVTAELTATELSEAALVVMESDLSAYPERDVLTALNRCRRELTGRLTLAAVLERLQAADGRPTGDEAWAIAIQSADESETVVWTDEMAKAWRIAAPIFEARDKVGARVAFRDAYERLCREARESNLPANWLVSQGWDSEKRQAAVQAAVQAGYLTASRATALLPAPSDAGPVGRLLLGAPTQEDFNAVSPEVVNRCRSVLSGMKSAPFREMA